MNNNKNNEKVIALLGDTHNGKAAALIEKDGSVFIRKPRSAEIELAFNAFLSRLKEEGFLYLPGTVTILKNEENMHEVEIVPHSPVEKKSDFNLYYKRCGALLFFTYLFSSTDLHDENITASGAYPVIIDYETLISADFSRRKEFMSIDDTVLGTHLLSIWQYNSDGKINLGGLTGTKAKLPFFKDEKAYAYNYIEDILDGFDYSYRFAIDNRKLFHELISLFDDCLFRVILRPTVTYSLICKAVAQLEEKNRLSSAENLLSRAYKADIDKNRLQKAQKVLDAEIKSVVANEIPIFYIRGGGKNIESRNECLWKDYFRNTPLEKATARLDSLCESDLEDEKRIIRISLNASVPLSEKKTRVFTFKNGLDIIYYTLEEYRINKLPFKWPFLYHNNKGNVAVASCGFGLYNGLVGILCCYAAIYRKTQNADVLDSIKKCYSDFHSIFSNYKTVFNDSNVSLSTGIGGILNGLCHISELTDNRIFYDDACRILDNVTLPKEKAKYNCDVLGGISGFALALPKIKTDKSKAFAVFLAENIIQYEPELTGTGHGAAGIALALGALGKVLKTNKYDEHIIQLIEWENRHFDSDTNNWYDLRKTDTHHYSYGWCSGMPGIGMARKKLLEYTNNPQIKALCEKDIKCATLALSQQLRLAKDHLCCGNSALLIACSYLGIEDNGAFKELYEKILTDSLVFSHPADTCDINPGLMQGLAGVGYALAMYQDKLCGEMLL